MKDLQTRKSEALEIYKEAKREYMEDFQNKEKFKKFCEAKRACMLLGVRI